MDKTRSTQLVWVATRSLGIQQRDAIDALISEPTINAAALKAGIGEDLLRSWLKDPTFNAKYRAAHQVAADASTADAVVRLQREAGAAVDALARNLTCGEPAVEVEAAKAILEHAAEALARSERRLPRGEKPS